MILALQPNLPVVWRSPTSLQIGVDRPVVVLTEVSTAEEHLLAALAAGVSDTGLAMIGRSVGAGDREVASLLARLEPALAAPTPAEPRPGRVVVEGDSACTDVVRSAVARAGHALVARPVRHSEARASAYVDLAVVVARFAVPPALYGYWSRRDIPLLPVVFSDTRVTIGPLTVPGTGACLHCVDRHRTDADPAWPAIASQVAGRPSAAETTLTATDAGAIVGRVAHAWLTGGANTLADRAVTVDAESGAIRRRRTPPHADCGCLALPRTATRPAQPIGAGPSHSRTAEALAEPA